MKQYCSLFRIALSVVIAAAVPMRAGAQVTKLLELDGDDDFALFGRVAYVGDVDGDGYADFAVGALRDDTTNGLTSGAAYLYSGRTAALLKTWLGDAAGDTFGDTVRPVGDLNSDGYDDIAISATSWNTSPHTQYVRVFSGRFLRDGTLPEVLFDFAPTTQGDVGLHLGGAGDVDGDGFGDLLVGCGFGFRHAYVVSGRTGASLIDLAVNGASDLGVAVAGLDDIDGDGYADFLVGSYRETVSGMAQAGSVYLYAGGLAGKIGTLLDEVDGDSAMDWFGIAVERIGDIDADGVQDFAVGASGQPDSATSIPGYVRLFSGATRTEITTYDGKNAGDFFGIEFTTGDVTGDGVVDLVVSARNANDPSGHGNTGAVTAFSGADGSELYEIFGNHAGDKIGRLDAGGDVDGDGYADLLIGTGHVTVGTLNDAGAVFVISGQGCLASSSNYGNGFAGTNGIPSLTTSAPPALGSDFDLTIGNSAGTATSGLLLLGTTAVQTPTRLGGDLLVAISLVVPIAFPSGQDLVLSESLPYDTLFCGLDVYLQALVIDPGAQHDVAFTPGLDLFLGGVPW
jgi:hypothetical protein